MESSNVLASPAPAKVLDKNGGKKPLHEGVSQRASSENVDQSQGVPKQDVLDSGDQHEENDDEDVPSDFFDDFSNQDFMAGLDVVDTWDDDPQEAENKTPGQKDLREKLKQKVRRSKSPRRRSRDRSPIRKANYRRREVPRYGGRSNRSKERDKRHKSKEKSREKKSSDRRKPKDKSSSILEKESAQKIKAEEDRRRDPEKTKRDIQKDKVKCAKDKEAKFICEKLKVVETGLVPPGTEMDVDMKVLETVLKVKEDKPSENKRKEKTSAVEKPEKPVVRRSKSRSFNMYRPRFLRGRNYSPRRRSRERSVEFRARPKRSRSPYRPRSRSPLLLRRRSLERKLYEDERRKLYTRETSPAFYRHFARERSPRLLSPESNISEREMWLRQKEIIRVGFNRSCSPKSGSKSPKRRKTRDFLEELDEKLKSADKEALKKSFFKEIQEKINGTSKESGSSGGIHQANYSAGLPIPVPAPVPAPTPMNMHGSNPNQMMGGMIPLHGSHSHPVGPPVPVMGHIHAPEAMPMAVSSPMHGPGPQFFPQMVPAPQYDQQFFIGHPNNDPYNQGMHPNPLQPYIDLQNAPQIRMDSPGQFPGSNSNQKTRLNNVDVMQKRAAGTNKQKEDNEKITKLFEDKKISLSDFLSITAKNSDKSRPVNIQNKIKVISRCQDAIKALGGDSTFGGRFFVKKLNRDSDKQQESKFMSPLRRVPVIRFNFTTPAKVSQDKSTFNSTLNKLLASLGLHEEVAAAPATKKSPVVARTAAKFPAAVKTTPNRPIPAVKPVSNNRNFDILGVKFQMKMTQTDLVQCHICEIRNARKFTDYGTQCTATQTYDAGTQVTDEDWQRMYPKPVQKGILKNQSLASLTPAQLLAQTEMDPQGHTSKREASGSKMNTPPPPDISPEKYMMKMGMPGNDGFPQWSRYDPSGPNRFPKDTDMRRNEDYFDGFKRTQERRDIDEFARNRSGVGGGFPGNTSFGPGSFDNKPALFDDRPNSFDNRPKSLFDNRPNSFDGRPNSFGNRSNTFENRSSPFENRQNSFEGGAPNFNNSGNFNSQNRNSGGFPNNPIFNPNIPGNPNQRPMYDPSENIGHDNFPPHMNARRY